jgi:hypothetical protein
MLTDADNVTAMDSTCSTERSLWTTTVSQNRYMLHRPTYTLRTVTFLVAGGDPTAHTITFCIYELLKNPDVLKKLRAELDNAIPSDCIMPSIEQVKLAYLNCVIKETLRMHGPGFGTFRYCSRDTEVDGVTLPANTTLALWNPQGNMIYCKCLASIADHLQCTVIQTFGARQQMFSTQIGGAAIDHPRSPGLFSHSRMAREIVLVS